MLKGKIPLIVAGVLGLMAAFLAYQSIDRIEDRYAGRWETVAVVVASQDLQEGTVLQLDLVAKSYMPKQFVTANLLSPNQVERVVGQKLAIPLKAGEPVGWSHFRSEGTFERLSSIIPSSGRAVSLDFSGSSGVAGWVRPSDHVDILGTFQDPKDNQLVSVTLLQNVVVVATGGIAGNTNLQTVSKKDLAYSSVTLWVMPEEAEILALAAEVGKLRLSLRNTSDLGRVDLKGRVTQETLFDGQRLHEIQQQRGIVIHRLDEGKRQPQ